MTEDNIVDGLLYLSVPKKWSKTYYNLLYLLSCAGKNIIDDCNYTCSNAGRNVFNCWNLFQAALAANALGEDKKADLFINYIDGQLSIYAKNADVVLPNIDDSEYPKALYEINADGSYNIYIDVMIKGELYQTKVRVPNTVYYYGANTTDDATAFNIETLTKSEEDITGTEVKVVTTETDCYVWFVSVVTLSFKQAGFDLDMNEDYINGLHYYHTDALIPGDNVFLVNKQS